MTLTEAAVAQLNEVARTWDTILTITRFKRADAAMRLLPDLLADLAGCRAENARLREALKAATACSGWCEVKTERFDGAGHTVGGHCQCGAVRRRMDATLALARMAPPNVSNSSNSCQEDCKEILDSCQEGSE